MRDKLLQSYDGRHRNTLMLNCIRKLNGRKTNHILFYRHNNIAQNIQRRYLVQNYITNLLFRLRVFVTQEVVGKLVFLDGGETAYRRVKAVFGIVIVALAHFAQQHNAGTLFHGKIVVQKLLSHSVMHRCTVSKQGIPPWAPNTSVDKLAAILANCNAFFIG